MPKLADLQESRAAASRKMRAILEAADAETRDLSEDEDKQFKTLKGEVAGLDKKIERQRDLDEAERRAPAVLHNGRGDGSFEDRAREFSISKAIRSAIGDPVDAAFEREISAETERRTGRQARGIMIPDQAFQEKRVLTAASGGADLYPEIHRGDLFIDRLRASLVTARLGATVIDGLVGDISIPRLTGSVALQWLAEDEDIDASDPTFDDVTLAPHTIGGLTSYSRKLLMNSSPSIDAIIRNDLAATVANAIDAAAILSDGSGNSPVGVIEQDGVHEVALGTLSWAKVLEMVATVQADNADLGGLGWAMNAYAAATLRATPRDGTNGGEGYIMDGPATLAGFPAVVTSSLGGAPNVSPAEPATIVFGSWSQLLIGRWGGVDILANPYAETAYVRGRVMMRVMADVDVAVRHPESFAFATDLAV